MDSNKSNTVSRRRLLTAIAAGGGAVVANSTIPKTWSSPVTHSVMIPAHAQATGFADRFSSVVSALPVGSGVDPDEMKYLSSNEREASRSIAQVVRSQLIADASAGGNFGLTPWIDVEAYAETSGSRISRLQLRATIIALVPCNQVDEEVPVKIVFESADHSTGLATLYLVNDCTGDIFGNETTYEVDIVSIGATSIVLTLEYPHLGFQLLLTPGGSPLSAPSCQEQKAEVECPK